MSYYPVFSKVWIMTMKAFRRDRALVQVGCHGAAMHLEWVFGKGGIWRAGACLRTQLGKCVPGSLFRRIHRMRLQKMIKIKSLTLEGWERGALCQQLLEPTG